MYSNLLQLHQADRTTSKNKITTLPAKVLVPGTNSSEY